MVTYVASTQTGDKIQANTPLVSIAPKGARSVLKIDIHEKDRGFLREGQEVKMKFSAFPYQRYGFISGTLDYISPSTQRSQSKASVYKGHVSLDKDYLPGRRRDYPLRYGMAAVAEIVVRKRRLIEWPGPAARHLTTTARGKLTGNAREARQKMTDLLKIDDEVITAEDFVKLLRFTGALTAAWKISSRTN